MKRHLHLTSRLCLLGLVPFCWLAAQDEAAASYGRKVATDPDGNVIVAGDTTEGMMRERILILKYSGAGVPLWTNRFGPPTNGIYKVSGLAVDNSGNVFVAGAGGGHYVTIAYSPAGVTLWTNRHDEPNNFNDAATALAVDHHGNVFVTGYSAFNGGPSFYTTIAYSGAGVALWTNRYGPGGTAMAVDARGNVIITGSSYNGMSYDYATVAYSGAGVALWTNRYDAGSYTDDFTSAIAVDRNGNVFVTGYSGYACVTIAYSGAGVPFWTNRYDRPGFGEDLPRAVAVDHNGNVFITGHSKKPNLPTHPNPDADYVTIAYSGAGAARWTNFHALPGNNGYDSAYALAVDASGNVLVTGTSEADFLTIKYSGTGVALWTNRFDGATNTADGAFGAAVDASGNVFVTGIAGPDCLTIAYSAAGAALWTNRYTNPVLPRLAVQPLVAASSTVSLNLSGPTNAPWTIQRALTIAGPWTNLGPSLTGTNGSGTFLDADPPPKGAFYRVAPP